MGNFNNLVVWKRAKEIAVEVYKTSVSRKSQWDYGFKDQILRSALSIPSNIAEGEQLDSDKQTVKHFYIARGSTAEMITLLIIGKEIGYFTTDESDKLINECRFISVCLTRLIKARFK